MSNCVVATAVIDSCGGIASGVLVAQRLRIRLHGAGKTLRLQFEGGEKRGSIVTVVRDVLADEVVGNSGELLFHFMK